MKTIFESGSKLHALQTLARLFRREPALSPIRNRPVLHSGTAEGGQSSIGNGFVLTFGLVLLLLGAVAAQAQNPITLPTCKTTVTPTNNWVVTTLGARVYSITALNRSASDQYLFIVNTNSAAGNGTLPAVAPILVPAGRTGWWDWQSVGFTFDRGVVVCSSSTSDSLTIGSADLTISVNYHGKN
jgi:hypothetical protein